MFAENYVELLKIRFKDKKLYNKDIKRVMDWEEVVEDFLTYEDFENESIIDHVYNLTDKNSNCELI